MIGESYYDIQRKYSAIVTMCFVRADESEAFLVFFDGKTKLFKSPKQAEEYILKKYKSMII